MTDVETTSIIYSSRKEEIKVKSKREQEEKEKKIERTFQSVCIKRELKTPTTNILNKHKNQNRRTLAMVANGRATLPLFLYK